jgi:Fe-S-cluster containining protein
MAEPMNEPFAAPDAGNRLTPHAARPNLAVPEDAQRTHRAIVDNIDWLLAQTPPVHGPDFGERWRAIMTMLARYQQQVIAATDYRAVCGRGCSACCFHWVEDVYSFEAELIAMHIRVRFADMIPAILERCRADEQALIALQDIVDRKLAGADDPEAAQIDSVDLLLASFYQLKRPCPLLAGDGSCGIYAVRPLTCRIYMSFSDPSFCEPEHIHDDEIRTYLLDVEEHASQRLDRLHERYDRFDGDTGLRSLLIKLLG